VEHAVLHHPPHLAGPEIGRRRRQQRRGAAADLGDARPAAGDDGHAVAHRLHQRDAETLVKRGINERRGAAVEGRQHGPRDAAELGDDRAGARARDRLGHRAAAPPADEHHPERARRHAPQSHGGVDQHLVVLVGPVDGDEQEQRDAAERLVHLAQLGRALALGHDLARRLRK
jgi:hypothetical protein